MKKQNLAQIKKISPEIGAALETYAAQGELVETPGGGWDVQVGGKSVFGKPLEEHFKDQMAAFWSGGRRIASHKPEPGEADYFSNRFLGRVLERAGAEGIAFSPAQAIDQSYFLVVLGLGLGGHLDELADLTDCRHMVVIENSLEFLYHSLEVYDWAGLIKKLHGRGARLEFFINDNPADIAGGLRTILRTSNPAAFDGATIFIDQTNGHLGQGWQQFLATEAVNVLAAVGCFNDERVMMQNALRNFLKSEGRIFNRRHGVTFNVPVFVVASGPSLDGSLDVIRSHADSVIIVSCGTAIRPLLAAGIVPDFHAEIENLGITEMLRELKENHDLSQIHLVASATVEPGVAASYKDALYFFRAGSTTELALTDDDDTGLPFAEPGVTNTAFAFAMASGAKNIYLFGVDLGVRGDGHHHAQNTYHDVEGGIKDEYVYSMDTEANFGGGFKTEPFLEQTKSAIALCIRTYGDNPKVFNCSDGALIPGAEPLRPEDLELDGPETDKKTDKAAAMESLIQAMPTLSANPDRHSFSKGDFSAATASLIDQCLVIVGDASDFKDKTYLSSIVGLLHTELYAERPMDRSWALTASCVLRGTVLNLLFFFEYYLNRVSDPGHFRAMEEIVKSELISSLGELRATAVDEISKLERGEMDKDGEDSTYVDVLPEVYHTWGDVSRNDPCPCGSGKRFKHCHGRPGAKTAASEWLLNQKKKEGTKLKKI